MIVQFSTGGRSGAERGRGAMLYLKPDIASLATGSCNFPTRVYENSPDLIGWLAAEMFAHGNKVEGGATSGEFRRVGPHIIARRYS